MPNDKNVQTAFEMFLNQGIVGAVALLAIAALIWAIVKLLVSKDERIKDQTLFAAALQKTNEGISALTVEVNKSAVAAVAEAGRSASTLSMSVQNLEKSVGTLNTEIGKLRDEQVRLVATLNNGGPPARGRR